MRTRRRPAESEAVRTDHAVAYRPGHGESIGGWQLRERVGRGGNASVWRAVDSAGNPAALKFPHANAPEWVRHEHRLLARLAHPNVVATRGAVESGECAALVIEYLPNGDLVALAGSAARHWLAALGSVLAALRHMHVRGYAHCDLKARNVLFGADGGARLIDFAAARPLDAPVRRSSATAECVPAGGVASALEVDRFAFAALAYELVTGGVPYGAAGQRRPGERPRPAVVPEGPLAPLLATAVDVLCAGGRHTGGLSAMADDIEFAMAAYR
ncbi:MAG TPA: protein kinase [Gammaproteobacteria bacterium]|jgi:serine/threonine protein kinase|nr:protein kinase [Gammaproteobacteria bacterium]